MILEISIAIMFIVSNGILAYICHRLMKYHKEMLNEVTTAMLAKSTYELQKPSVNQTSISEPLYKEVSTLDDSDFMKHIEKTINRDDNEDNI